MFTGWKTYLFMLLSGLVTVLYSQGIIGQATYTFLIGILAPAGVIALRVAVGRTEKKADIAAQASTEAAAAAALAEKAAAK